MGGCRSIIVAICVVGWLAMSFVGGDRPSRRDALHAAPPIVRTSQHPFDPDWLTVWTMLRTKCNGCHRPGTNRHDFSSYATLMAEGPDGADSPVVVPGRPDESVLLENVQWDHHADPASNDFEEPLMPPDRADWLTAGQVEAIERWIANGALEYRLPDQCNIRPLLETDFPSAKECAACHPKQYEEWSRSMHAYAQHSPVLESFTLRLVERTEGTIGTFCTRCHTPIGVSLGETASTRNVHRSRLSMEGITCVVCHRLEQPYYKSNGRTPVTPGQLLEGCMFGPFIDPVRPDAGAHAARGSAYLLASEFCGTCHDVTSPQGVRLEEAFSEWQNSPAAKQGVSCHECHMGPIQGVPTKRCDRPLGRAATVPGIDPESIPLRPLSDHTFAGPDYSLLPDTEFPHKLDWMYEVDYRNVARLTPHQRESLTEVRVLNRRQLEVASAKRYELLKNAASISVATPTSAEAGDRIKVKVTVTSKTAGHNFPTGFSAERQAWVELRVFDPQGRQVFASGDLDANGDLRDSHSHAVEAGTLSYDRHLLNFQSEFTALTAVGTERSVVIPVNRHLSPLSLVRPTATPAASFGRPFTFRVAKGSLPPLQSASHTYPVRLPKLAGAYRVQARLNFRHLPPVLLDSIGLAHLKHLLETVVIDEQVCVIPVR